MGNLLSSGGRVKVSFPDGVVRELDVPTSVAELMLEHPQQFVVDVRSLSAGKAKAAAVLPLPSDHVLEPGGVYVMLPMARGKAAGFSKEEARRALLATTARPSLFLRALGVRGVGVEAGRNTKYEMAEEAKIGRQESKTFTKVMEERPELSMRQYSSRRWKPSLVTIEEKSLGRKLPHWLF